MPLLGYCFEPVADAVAGLDERVARRAAVDLLAQPPDEDVHGPVAVVRPPAPDLLKELAARVRAAARRGVSEAEPRRGDAILIEELRLDPDNVQAYVDGKSAELTPTEFRLLYTLAREKGRVLTRDELLQRVWGRRASHRDRTVDVFVRKLREKIDARSSGHTFIQTRYGVGYKLDPAPK